MAPANCITPQAQLAELKEKLRNARATADALFNELRLARTASRVGCKKEELVGTKVSCPQDKLGAIIGKKGSNVRHLQSEASVTVNVLKEGDVRILGSIEALDAATSNLLKVIDSVEETVDDPTPHLVQYLTSKGITALTELSARHPDVRLSVQRQPHPKIVLKGLQSNVDSLRKELLDMDVTIRVINMTDTEAAHVVGKQGATVDGLVATFQAAIDVTRSSKNSGRSSSSSGGGDGAAGAKTTATTPAMATVTVAGPAPNVEAAQAEIERLAAEMRESTRVLDIHPAAKNALLLAGGAGIQQLSRRINEGKSSGFVNVSFDGNRVALRGRAASLMPAIEIAEAEIRRVEALTVTVPVDPAIIPTIIGKGGESIKSIKGDKPVVVEIQDSGAVVICACEKEHVDAAVQAVRDIVSGNAVKRISVDAAAYKRLSGDLLRTKSKEINGICKLSLDEDKCQFVIRGEPDMLAEAESIIQNFLDSNYVKEIAVTDDDLSVLLTGGKSCKAMELSAKLDVKINANRDRSVVEVRGEQAKVQSAVKALNQFLFGGDGAVVHRLVLSQQLVGFVIGKGGKNKMELQAKFPSVAIAVSSADGTITLRGPEAEAEECRVEVMKHVAGAQVTETISISSKLHERFSKRTKPRDLIRDIPVQLTLAEDMLKVRGYAADVRDAVAILNDAIHGKYEARLALTSQQFTKVTSSCRSLSSPLQRAMDSSGATVVLDSSDESLVFRGKCCQVKAAKNELFKFFDFLFGSAFARLELPGPLVATVGKIPALSELAAKSGASIQLDRDTGFVLLYSTDATKLAKAVEGVQAKIDKASRLFFELQFEPSESWIVASIIGTKGDHINKLRKATKCDIEADSAARTVLVKSQSEELVEKARSTFDELVEKIRRENAVIAMADIDLPVFIGRAGAKIVEFSEKYQVEAKVQRNSTPPSIRFTGSESAVAAAKDAALAWIVARDEARKEADTVETLSLRREHIPAVIGVKGSTIRSLQAEFGCKVDVDRATSTVSVRGGNAEKRALTLDKIKAIMKDVRETVLESEGDKAPASPNSSPKEVVALSPDRDTNLSKPPLPPTPPRATAVAARPALPVPRPSDFPELARPPPPAAGLSETKVILDPERATARQHFPEIMSSSTCSTAGSSKDEDDDDDVGEEESEGPVLSWSHVVAGRSPAESDMVDTEA
jgi:polyribonucleotide nucleotidyltransferase